MKLSSIYEDAKFTINQGVKFSIASLNQIDKPKVSEELKALRLDVCSSCPLFIDNKCSSLYYTDGVELVEEKGYELIKDNWNISRALIKDNKKYTRGCGCPVETKAGYYFSKDQLNDGSSCPRNLWVFGEIKELENGNDSI